MISLIERDQFKQFIDDYYTFSIIIKKLKERIQNSDENQNQIENSDIFHNFLNRIIRNQNASQNELNNKDN